MYQPLIDKRQARPQREESGSKSEKWAFNGYNIEHNIDICKHNHHTQYTKTEQKIARAGFFQDFEREANQVS